jgi:transcriptional regulator with XRE-family HTH domain
MNDIQLGVLHLKELGWTLAAIADELGVTPNAVEKWKAGDRKPHSEKAILIRLEQLGKKKPPKQRRYAKGNRTKKGSCDGSK